METRGTRKNNNSQDDAPTRESFDDVKSTPKISEGKHHCTGCQKAFKHKKALEKHIRACKRDSTRTEIQCIENVNQAMCSAVAVAPTINSAVYSTKDNTEDLNIVDEVMKRNQPSEGWANQGNISLKVENHETHTVNRSEMSDARFMQEEAQSSSGEFKHLKESTLEEQKPNQSGSENLDNDVFQKMTIQTATDTFDIVYMKDRLSRREHTELGDEVNNVLSTQTDNIGEYLNQSLLINQNLIGGIADSEEVLQNSLADRDEGRVIKTETVPLNVEGAAMELSSHMDSTAEKNTQLRNSEDINARVKKSKVKKNRGGEKLRKCNQCDETFEDIILLRRHKKTHLSRLKAYKCDSCSASFHFRYRLEDHINMHLGIHAHECTICSHKFSSKGTLRIHMKKHLGTLPFSCTVCSQGFADRVTLEKHENSHKGTKPAYTCDKCEKTYVSAVQLRKHMRTHASRDSSQNVDLQTTSETFDIVFLEDQQDVQHEDEDVEKAAIQLNPTEGTPMLDGKDVGLPLANLGDGAKTNEANSADILFFSSNEASALQSIPLREDTNLILPPEMNIDYAQNGDNSFDCVVCGKTALSKSALKSHMRQHRKIHKCHICNSTFSSTYLLTCHVNVHLGIKPFDCCVCKRKFSSSSTLRLHFKKHNRLSENASCGKVHICCRCGKSFASGELLRQHSRVHRQYRCPYCLETFPSDRNLKIHTATKHFNTKQYQCFYCTAGYSVPRDFEAHGRSKHLKTESYQCRDCGKPYKQPDNIRRHVEKAHPQSKGKVYGCNHCEASFVKAAELVDHLRTHLLHTCAVCGEGLATFIGLKQHIESNCEDGNGAVMEDTAHRNANLEQNTDVEMEAQEEIVCYSEDAAQGCVPNDLEDLISANPDECRTDINPQLYSESATPSNVLQAQEEKNINLHLNSNIPNTSDILSLASHQPQSIDLSDQNAHCAEVLANQRIISLKTENQNDYTGHTGQSETSEVPLMPINTDLEFLSDGEEEQSAKSGSSRKFKSPQEPTATDLPHNGSQNYKCHMCDASFDQYESLNQHRRQHSTGIKAFECHICPKKFKFPSRLKIHIQEHLGKLPFRCTMCEKSFAFASLLKSHRSHHFRKCRFCDAGDFSLDQLKEHMKTHRRRKAPRLKNKGTASEESKINIESHEAANAQPYGPTEVGLTPENLNLATVTNAFDIVFVADQQGVLSQIEHKEQDQEKYVLTPHADLDAFGVMPALEINEVYPQNCEKSLACVPCGETFASESLLNAHTRRHRPFKCADCLGTFRSSYTLRVHLRKHMEEHEKRAAKDRHICTRCDEAFESVSELKKHSYIHRRFKCHYCIKTFSDDPSLQTHIAAKHMNPSALNCFLCPAVFIFPRDLEAHARSKHMENNPCKCMECHKTFKHPVSIKIHARKFHANRNGKIYGCRYCEADFLNSSEILDHLKIHLLHKCTICRAGCATFIDLRHHMETHSEDANRVVTLGTTQLDPNLEQNTHIAVEMETQADVLKNVVNYSEDLEEACEPNVFIVKQELLNSIPDGGGTETLPQLYFESAAPCDEGDINLQLTPNIPKISDHLIYVPSERKSTDLSDEKSHNQADATLEENISIITENQNNLPRDKVNCTDLNADHSKDAEAPSMEHNFEKEFLKHIEEVEEEESEYSELTSGKLHNLQSKINKTYKNEYGSHSRQHSYRRYHECHICRKKFAFPSRLRLHIEEHMGLLPFGCTMCQKRFPFVSMLRRHQELHSRRCSKCDAGGFTLLQLTQHMKTHERRNNPRLQKNDVTFEESKRNTESHEEATTPQYSPPEVGLEKVTPQNLNLSAVTNSFNIVFVADQQGVLSQIEHNEQDEEKYVLTPHADLDGIPLSILSKAVDKEVEVNPPDEEFISSDKSSALQNSPISGYALGLMPVLKSSDQQPEHTDLSDQKPQFSELATNEANIAIKTEDQNHLPRDNVNSRDHNADHSKTAELSSMRHNFENEFLRYVVDYGEEEESDNSKSTGKLQNVESNKSKIYEYGLSHHECHICRKILSSHSRLNSHIAGHMGALPFLCKICQRSFRHSSSLKRHEETHSRKCSFCNASGFSRPQLRKHLTTHWRWKASSLQEKDATPEEVKISEATSEEAKINKATFEEANISETTPEQTKISEATPEEAKISETTSEDTEISAERNEDAKASQYCLDSIDDISPQ